MDTIAQLAPHLSRLDLTHATLARDAEPSARPLRGAVLFTDFAGFTSLTERLAADGPIGAERLSEILNWSFGILTDAITQHGGDVVLFAGDALLALFEADGDEVAATRAAVQSALAMQHALATGTAPHGASLGLRTTIGAGSMHAQRVGGVDGRWVSLLGGPAVDDTFAADRAARPGTVIATATAWTRLAAVADGALHDGDRIALVHGMVTSVFPAAAAKIPIDEGFGKSVGQLMLPVVRDRLLNGVAHAAFMAEFRDASVAFVRVSSVDPGRPEGLDRLHAAAIAAEEEAGRFDGTLYQLVRDEKGCTAVLAFGLPGQAHDDDAARVANAASSLCARLRELGMNGGAGVATGPVFCGVYGGATRQNYGIMGPTMNRAARLMQSSQSVVVADSVTEARAKRWLDFRALPPIHAKGIAAPIPAFEPLSRRLDTVSRSDATAPIIGRTAEREHLSSLIAALQEHRSGGGIVIEGDAGMGKSTLLRTIVDSARERGLHTLEGSADSIEQGTAYLALRPVIGRLLGIPVAASPDQARDAAERQLARLPRRMHDLAPLLNVVLPLDFPETPLTLQMSGTIRAANLTDLLTGLVEAAAADAPILLALEDLHWMDDASLQLCGRLVESIPGMLLIATARPMSPAVPAITRLSSGSQRAKLPLETLAPEEIVELIRRRLGASTIPAAVKELILAKAEGNPLYSEEVVLALRESGAIEVVNGECRLTAPDALAKLNLPGTVRGIITSRVDRLPADSQLTLKVASVLGRSFDTASLRAVHPQPPAAAALTQLLRSLEEVDLLAVEPGAGDRFAFRHALIQETIYGLLPFAQRRPLHAAAAAHLESVHADDLSPYYARLAHHWSRAERPERAVRYLGEAGRQALESYANQSAVDFFSEAIKLDEQLRGAMPVDRTRASWHRQLAEGHYSLIQWDEARTHYEQAIQLSGFPAPRFGMGTTGQVLKHVVSRYLPRMVAGDPARLTPDDRERAIEALRACDNLQVVYLWQGNRLSLAHTVFEGANIAARVGPGAESAFARAMLGYLLVMSGMRGTAERDLRAAVAMANESGQLLQRVSCNMYLGMTLSLLGRPLEGIPYLETADELVGQLGAGLWKHRGKYMLAEPHLMVGNLDRAGELFSACATISMSVEPPITGFANAMRALCLIRQGRADEGIALIKGPHGMRLVRDNPIGLQLYNTLGALIEGCLWTGEWREALEAAREGVAIPERGDDANSFFTGYNGHAAVARLFLALIEQRRARDGEWESLPTEEELWVDARRALRNFRKGARLFPGAQAPYLLVEGLSQAQRGRHDAARLTWLRCIDIADRASMPYERAMAHYELGRHTSDDDARTLHLRAAYEDFAQAGMTRYAERCVAAGLEPALVAADA